MLKIQRALRFKDEIELPNGEVVTINFNAEARAFELLKAQNELIRVTQNLKGKTMSTIERKEYHRAYMGLIEVIFGDITTRKMLAAVDDDREELICALDSWIAENIIPLGVQASRRIRERKAAEYLHAKK